MLHSLFRLFSQCNQVLEHLCYHVALYSSLLRAILSELQPLFVRQYLVVILTMFSSLFTCLTMFFHCFGPLLPLFIFFLPWSFWPCCTHFSGFLHFLRVWPCFFTVLALCYHFLYFSYLGHFDHVALTFQVFFTFDVSDHVFSLFWPSATTFYIFLTLVILTMLHSLFRFSSLFTCLTMFFHCFGPLLPLFILFLPWSFWPCCTLFSGFLHFCCVWPCFFTLLASATTFYIFLTLVILTMLHSLFRLVHNAVRCLRSSATMWHKFKSVRAILSELQPLFVC